MSEGAAATAGRVTMLYHPTLAVRDLEVAREWFTRVFARRDVRWEDAFDVSLLNPSYTLNYSFFAFVTDFHFVVISPSLHSTGALAGQDRYRDVPEGMVGIGWYADEVIDVYARLAEHGFPAHDQKQLKITPSHPPVSAFAPDVMVGFTYPEQAGMRHEFVEVAPRHTLAYSKHADPRLRQGWESARDPRDPLTIERSSHHTIVTADLGRALRLYRDCLGGEVIDAVYNVELDADGTFIRLADAVIEFALPRAGSAANNLVREGTDHYQGISLVIGEQAAAEQHLRAVGCEAVRVDASTLRIDPEEAFGMQWRFIAAPPYETNGGGGS